MIDKYNKLRRVKEKKRNYISKQSAACNERSDNDIPERFNQ